MNKALFLDRDGTLIKDQGYLADFNQLELLPGVGEGLVKAQAAGYKLIVISNQSGVARGYFPESRVLQVNAFLENILAERGVQIDKFYYCPHHPKAIDPAYRKVCDCRKPAPGMVLTAERELEINRAASYLIGDKIADVETGAAAGVKTVLLLSGVKSRYEAKSPVYCLPDLLARNFSQAIESILNQNE